MNNETGLLLNLILWMLVSCTGNNNSPSTETINSINLKRGNVALCGSPGNQFGSVEFETSCSEKVNSDFNLAIALLHSFEYDEAEKVFAKIIDDEPGCAMAYWGVAMCSFHQLWPSAPGFQELEKGNKAIEAAQSISVKSQRESDYINAIALFYHDWDKADHHSRVLRFEKAMEKLHELYPEDKEAAIFYALSLDAAADPSDKSFSRQRKAGSILNSLYPGEPDHPGIVHYIIHTYDYPELAESGLAAARKFDSIAPASAHARHMPSHIYTRLGLWNECIRSNLSAAASAKCYAENTGIKGNWDEELHCLDYLVYAYLQKGENKLALEQWDYLQTIHEVFPESFKAAYAFAAIPARYLLENKMWKEAARLEIHPSDFPWKKFPWQKAIHHFTRLLGSVHTGQMDAAKAELKFLNTIYDTLSAQKDLYKANQVLIQIKTAEAWIQFKEGKNNEGLNLMVEAADMEDKTEKSPVTPGEVLPAMELLGDMLLQMKRPDKALNAYEADLNKHHQRFNGLYGAALAAQMSGNFEKAKNYFSQLTAIAIDSKKPEIKTAASFLKQHKD